MSDSATADTLRERVDMNAYWFWLLVEANRWALAGGIATVIFLVFMLLGVVKPVTLQTAMQSGNMVGRVFGGLLGAIITGATLVVTINQLVLSQEIGSLGDQRSRMDTTLDVRQTTDELLGGTTPIEPSAYLGELIGETERRATRLRETLAAADDAAPAVDYLDDLLASAERTRHRLEGADFGTFGVLSPALDYNYDRKLHEIRRLEATRDDLTDAERTAFRDLVEALAMYGVGREYVKDLYIQWSLVRLSRAILYAAVVALTVAGAMVVFITPTTFSGTVLGIESLLWVVSAAFAVSTLPFLLFMSVVLRLATITKQTLSMGPLVLK